MTANKVESAPSQPVTADQDIKAHMLATYKALRWLMAMVTGLFLITLTGYRLFGKDSTAMPRESISAYYWHHNDDFPMKDVFVGALVGVGLLLMSYQGYTDRENWALNTAGVAIICVVFLPMDWDVGKNAPGPMTPRGWAHYACAFFFFLPLAYVALFRAQDTLGLLPDGARKMLFKNLYRVIGLCMAVVPFLTAGFGIFGDRAWLYKLEYTGAALFLAYWAIKSNEIKASLAETVGGIREMEELAVGPKGDKGGRGEAA
jgi:hypothetical protein